MMYIKRKGEKIMKKLRIFMLLAILVFAVAALCSCNKLSLEDVKEDPQKYVSDGMELILENTVWDKLPELNELSSYSYGYDGENEKTKFALGFDTEEEKLFFDVDSHSKTEITDEFGDAVVDETDVDFSLYVDGKKVALRTEAIKDALETDIIGCDFAALKDNIKDSAIYTALLDMSGLKEDELDKELDKLINGDIIAEEDKEDLSDIGKALKEYTETLKELQGKLIKVDDVKEETLPIGKKGTDTVVVYVSADQKIYKKCADATVDLFMKLLSESENTSLGTLEYTDDQLKEMRKSIEAMIPTTEMKGVYYLSKKTGALIKMTNEATAVIEVEDAEKESEKENKSKIVLDVTFGEKPEILILPEFTFSFHINDEGIEISGKTAIEDKSMVVNGECVLETEEDGKEEGTYKLIYKEDGSYTLTFIDEEKEEEIKGKFKVGENGIEFEAEYKDEDSKKTEKMTLSIKTADSIEKMPKFKDLLDLNEEEVNALLDLVGMGKPDYIDIFREELIWYYGTDDAALDAELADYAAAGAANEEDYLCLLFSNAYYSLLVDTYGADVVEPVAQELVNSGADNYELAVGMYELAYILSVPSEDEIRDFIENYELYGYNSADDVIAELRSYYGDSITIPEEYLD